MFMLSWSLPWSILKHTLLREHSLQLNYTFWNNTVYLPSTNLPYSFSYLMCSSNFFYMYTKFTTQKVTRHISFSSTAILTLINNLFLLSHLITLITCDLFNRKRLAILKICENQCNSSKRFTLHNRKEHCIFHRWKWTKWPINQEIRTRVLH